MICTECNKNEALKGEFCESCFNETKICRRCQKQKSIFEFEKNQLTKKPAQPDVLISCEESKVEILSQGKLLASVSGVEWKSNVPHLKKTCGAYDICHTLYWKKETQLKPVFGKSTSSRVRG